MKNPLGALSWRQAVIMIVALPLVISLAVLAYAWPSARIAPRDLPVGVVSAGPAGQSVVDGLERAAPGGFDVHRYGDEAAARAAIADRDVYGAFVVAPGGVTVLTASAASTSVAQLLDESGGRLAAKAGVAVRSVDVVPVSADDPRGVVFSSALLPLTMCSVIIALVVTMSGAVRPGWRRVAALLTGCAAAAFTVFLVAQGFLGALPHEHAATWAGLALTMLAISAPAAGLVTLVGRTGLGIGAVLMVFVGNPFSGSTSAPELLPKAVGTIGQWLPPGAGANLLRGTAYFGGSGSAHPLVVLALWSVLGLAAVATGRPAAGEERGSLVAGDGVATDGGDRLSVVRRAPAAGPAGRAPRP